MQHWWVCSDGDQLARDRGLFPDGPRWADTYEDCDLVIERGDNDFQEGRFFLKGDGYIAYDGSCLEGTSPWAVATAAIVQVHPVEGVKRAISSRVPSSWRHSAAAGEQLACFWASWASEEGVVALTDCAATVSCFNARDWLGNLPTRVWAVV